MVRYIYTHDSIYSRDMHVRRLILSCPIAVSFVLI